MPVGLRHYLKQKRLEREKDKYNLHDLCVECFQNAESKSSYGDGLLVSSL